MVADKNINSILTNYLMSFANWFGQRPQKAQPWSDVFVADSLGYECMQGNGNNQTYSEDCLHVNIYVPEVTI